MKLGTPGSVTENPTVQQTRLIRRSVPQKPKTAVTPQ